MSVNTTYIEGDVAVSRNATIGGEAIVRGNTTLDHNLKVKGWLDAQNIKGNNKGLFGTYEQLTQAYPKPLPGWFAAVVDDSVEPAVNVLYTVAAGAWTPSTGDPSIVSETAMFNSGQMLKDTNIVNDLTTGGVDDVLSAEQGKLLAKEVWEAKGVFDISYANRTSEDIADYARYESLSAALAAVPTSMQAGGMMVKFILRTNTGTDDAPVYVDRYVGYKLMSITWSTTVTNWQGIDDRPTEGSKNLVLSGGVWYDLNNIDWENLTEGLKNIILTVTHQGIPLTTEWGNNNDIGITQKTLTQTIVPMSTNVTIKILRIHDNTDDVDVSGTVLYVGKNYTVYLDTKMTSVVDRFDEVKVYESVGADTEQIDSGDDVSEQQTNVVLSEDATNTTYKFFSVGEICGVTGLTSNTVTVNTVYPIYFGANAAGTMTDAIATALTKAPAKTSCAGTYTVDNGADGNYIWFVIPTSISDNKPTAKMNGFEFPLADAQAITIDGVSYKAYRSVETQESSATAGDYNIVLS